MKKTIAFAIFSLATLLQSCDTPNAAAKSDKPAEKAVATASKEVIAQGRTLYDAKCQRCHSLYKTTDFTVIQWRKNVNDMAPKANLSDTEREAVFAYVVSNAKK